MPQEQAVRKSSKTREAINSALTALVAPIVLPPYILYKMGELTLEEAKRAKSLLERNLYRPPSPERASEYAELASLGLVSSMPGGPRAFEDASLGMIKGGTPLQKVFARKKIRGARAHFGERPPRTWLRRTKEGEMKKVSGKWVLADLLEPTISSKMVRGIVLHGGDPKYYPRTGETFKHYLGKPYFGEPWGISTTLLPQKVLDFIRRPRKLDAYYSKMSNQIYELERLARTKYPRFNTALLRDDTPTALQYLKLDDPELYKQITKAYKKRRAVANIKLPFARVQPLWTDVPERLILDNTTPRGWHTHTDAVLEALQTYPRLWERTPSGARLRKDYYNIVDRDMEFKIDLSKKVSKNLQKRGYMAILSNPHRYGEYELRIFPPEKLMMVDRRFYNPGSTVASKSDPGIRRLSGMIEPRMREYADAKIERPAHMGGPGAGFRTFGPKFGNLVGKASKTGPLEWGYAPWTGLKPQVMSPSRLRGMSERELAKLQKITPEESEAYLASMTKVQKNLTPEETDAMMVLKEFDPAYKAYAEHKPDVEFPSKAQQELFDKPMDADINEQAFKDLDELGAEFDEIIGKAGPKKSSITQLSPAEKTIKIDKAMAKLDLKDPTVVAQLKVGTDSYDAGLLTFDEYLSQLEYLSYIGELKPMKLLPDDYLTPQILKTLTVKKPTEVFAGLTKDEAQQVGVFVESYLNKTLSESDAVDMIESYVKKIHGGLKK